MPPPKKTLNTTLDAVERPYHHGDLRRAIVETASAMLREDKGWQFTMREVARRAGVSHAAPYKHFPDKAALLLELALRGFDQLGQELKAAIVPRPRSARKEFLAVGGAYIAFGMSNPALYRLMFSSDAGDLQVAHISESALSALGVLLDVLARGQESGAFRRRPLQGQAAACWAQVHGLTMLSIDGLLMPEKVGSAPVQAALDTLLDGVLG
ncbi:TetR/AcrR family transcriptional regulator [Duganella sp. LjRoot269]|uniref:TetR/AcrR family transcriptional regulator n=1 Tax=Duganella sp. LjRoot269 TaxID=3342305 RepID=UPI003ECDECC6